MDSSTARISPVFDCVYCFESYGVKICLESNSPSILAEASSAAYRTLAGNVKECPSEGAEHVFQFEKYENGECSLVMNGEHLTTTEPDDEFFRIFDSLARKVVGENTKSIVLVHAGVVGWRGKAIVIPGSSFSGKSTLVSELIRVGAQYYSDEYAALDADGMVHPFARSLVMRVSNGAGVRRQDIDASDFGANIGTQPVPPGLILFTKYEPEGHWDPEFLTPGNAVMKLLDFALPLKQNPEFAMKVLGKTAEGCLAVSSTRGDASSFASFLLEIVDKTIF